MQTFLPYPDFRQSASVLDRLRLGKQRVEVWQLLNAIHGHSSGWRNHPAAKMWRNHTGSLACYGVAICDEWIKRGYNDTMRERFLSVISELNDLYPHGEVNAIPSWFANPDFHRSHQSNLVRKMPEHYRKFFPDIEDNLPYIWPVP